MTVPTLEVHLTAADAAAALRSDVLTGLTVTPKWLPPKWFYDARGSELFEHITRLPEYFPFRTERELLRAGAGEIAAQARADTLVELGSGSAEKTRLLLDALTAAGMLRRFVPQDVSEAALAAAAGAIAADYPGLAVHAVVGDFTRHLELLPAADGGRRLVAFLGGTVGNLLPQEQRAFLTRLRAVLEPGETLLLGAGLVTDPDVLVRAYDDAAGVTAEFNRNVLHVLNRELDGNVEVSAFEHVAIWDAEREWIEMRLRASRAVTAHFAALDLTVEFAESEELRTEVSAKFRRDGITAELTAAGFAVRQFRVDPAERFALALAEATP